MPHNGWVFAKLPFKIRKIKHNVDGQFCKYLVITSKILYYEKMEILYTDIRIY